MVNIKTFFDSFKEFIWDIIGYLLPGSYILILLSACINSSFFISPSIGEKEKNFTSFVFIIISYLLGYVAYGFSRLKEDIMGKYSYVNKIEQVVSKRKEFELSKQLISKALLNKGITEEFSKTSIKEIRSIAMSFIPEQDQKIYTFTFRSDLSNQTGNISIVIGLLGILSSIINNPPIDLFKTDTKHIILYICLIISYFLLRLARNRFYQISISLPFSIYTANATK